jgi:hypothetical protein
MKSKTFKYLAVLPFMLLVGCTNIASSPTATSPSETTLITEGMEDEQRSKLATNVEKINKLVASARIAEDSIQKDPTNKNSHLTKAATDRNEVSTAYLKSADLINDSLLLLGTKYPSEASLSKEVVLAMREIAVRIRKENYPLNEFHPEKINLKDFDASISDVFKYFEPLAKNKMKGFKADLDLAKQANNREKTILTLKKISEIYIDQAKIIAINDPAIVEELRIMGNNILALADAVKQGKDSLPDSEGLGLKSLI